MSLMIIFVVKFLHFFKVLVAMNQGRNDYVPDTLSPHQEFLDQNWEALRISLTSFILVFKFPRRKIGFGFRKGIKNISNASQLITVNMFPLNVTLRLFESSQHYFPWLKVNLLSSHLPTI